MFYPMASTLQKGAGRRRQTSFTLTRDQKEAAITEVVQIHTRGFGPKGSVQPWPAWGARLWRHCRPGFIDLGYPPKRRNAKSSTMKGPQGLAGNDTWRRSRTGMRRR